MPLDTTAAHAAIDALAARHDEEVARLRATIGGLETSNAALAADLTAARDRIAALEARLTPPLVLGHFRNRPGESGTWRQRVDRATAQFGPFAGHMRDYLGVGHNGQLSAEHRAWLDAGGRLFLNWKPWSASWAQVASGARDSIVTAAAKTWAPHADRLWVTIGHEPENDLGGSGSGMTAADYVAMWRRVAPLVHRHAPGVQLVWTVIGDATHRAQQAQLWPGAEYVDILGHDPYIKAEGPPTNLARWILDDTAFLRTLPGAGELPVVLAEWGCDLGGNTRPHPTGDVGTPQHRADAINDVLSRLDEITAAGVVEMCFFDAGSSALSSDPTGPDVQAYKALKTATEAL